VLDPATGAPRTIVRPVPKRWAHFTGDDLNDILRPIVLARPAPSKDPEAKTKAGHGGDRRSAAFRAALASPPPCPHCGEDALGVVCGACGCHVTPDDFTNAAVPEGDAVQDETRDAPDANAATNETGFQDEKRSPHPGASPTFHDVPPKGVTRSVVRSHAVQDEKRAHSRATVPEEPAWLRDAPLPGFDAPPPDHRTDVASGARR
jgi:hypothetical protein